MFDCGPLSNIRERIEANQRLFFEDGVRLYESNDLPFLGRLAHQVRTRLHGKRVYYSVNFHLNHTNICTVHCLFCAFARRPDEEGGYTFTHEQIAEGIQRAVERYHINEIHMVGGLNPHLDLDYYLALFGMIRARWPDLYIKALTAVEIDDLAKRSGLGWQEVLIRLKEAGLDGLPGGGAEIFREERRRKICPDKATSQEWLDIHRIAHRLGLDSNCTMLYGHIETIEDRVDHILRLRELQDETGGFNSFIPLAFNAENTPIEKLGEPDGYTDLKVLAVSRLLFDNVPHIKLHWTSLDLKMASVGLLFGADDLGGTNINEKIMHDAGNETPVDMTEEKLRRFIERAGFEPVLVDSSYAATA